MSTGLCAVEKHPHERGEDHQHGRIHLVVVETPPRAWGRRFNICSRCIADRNTPTSVGKTRAMAGVLSRLLETPPRAWGRRCRKDRSNNQNRNTPTSVGKTHLALPRCCCPRKHPHERGEDSAAVVRAPLAQETPPRAWGRLSCRA